MIKFVKNDFFIYCKEARIESPRNFYGSFSLGPFEAGQSITIANALRRTLLSELKGLAITSAEIEGAFHEYSTLPGVRDSILDILLNLKDIILKSVNYGNQKKNGITPYATFKKEQTGYLKIRGPGIVTALDLKLPPGMQCVDPDQYIATLSEEGCLTIKFTIHEGKNYHFKKKSQQTLLQKKDFLSNGRRVPLPAFGPDQREGPVTRGAGKQPKISNTLGSLNLPKRRAQVGLGPHKLPYKLPVQFGLWSQPKEETESKTAYYVESDYDTDFFLDRKNIKKLWLKKIKALKIQIKSNLLYGLSSRGFPPEEAHPFGFNLAASMCYAPSLKKKTESQGRFQKKKKKKRAFAVKKFGGAAQKKFEILGNLIKKKNSDLKNLMIENSNTDLAIDAVFMPVNKVNYIIEINTTLGATYESFPLVRTKGQRKGRVISPKNTRNEVLQLSHFGRDQRPENKVCFTPGGGKAVGFSEVASPLEERPRSSPAGATSWPRALNLKEGAKHTTKIKVFFNYFLFDVRSTKKSSLFLPHLQNDWHSKKITNKTTFSIKFSTNKKEKKNSLFYKGGEAKKHKGQKKILSLMYQYNLFIFLLFFNMASPNRNERRGINSLFWFQSTLKKVGKKGGSLVGQFFSCSQRGGPHKNPSMKDIAVSNNIKGFFIRNNKLKKTIQKKLSSNKDHFLSEESVGRGTFIRLPLKMGELNPTLIPKVRSTNGLRPLKYMGRSPSNLFFLQFQKLKKKIGAVSSVASSCPVLPFLCFFSGSLKKNGQDQRQEGPQKKKNLDEKPYSSLRDERSTGRDIKRPLQKKEGVYTPSLESLIGGSSPHISPKTGGDPKEITSLKNNIIIEIWTNGSIHPRQALYEACKNLLSLFSKLEKASFVRSIFKSEKTYRRSQSFITKSTRLIDFSFPLLKKKNYKNRSQQKATYWKSSYSKIQKPIRISKFPTLPFIRFFLSFYFSLFSQYKKASPTFFLRVPLFERKNKKKMCAFFLFFFSLHHKHHKRGGWSVKRSRFERKKTVWRPLFERVPPSFFPLYIGPYIMGPTEPTNPHHTKALMPKAKFSQLNHSLTPIWGISFKKNKHFFLTMPKKNQIAVLYPTAYKSVVLWGPKNRGAGSPHTRNHNPVTVLRTYKDYKDLYLKKNIRGGATISNLALNNDINLKYCKSIKSKLLIHGTYKNGFYLGKAINPPPLSLRVLPTFDPEFIPLAFGFDQREKLETKGQREGPDRKGVYEAPPLQNMEGGRMGNKKEILMKKAIDKIGLFLKQKQINWNIKMSLTDYNILKVKPELVDIGKLNFSLRPYTCLKRANISTLGDLLKKSKEELLMLKNFGKQSLKEVEENLELLGLFLKLKTGA